MMAPPQTPRNKILSLDIPSPAIPSSPTSYAASPPTRYESVPASPTFSGSWNVSKTPAELTALLKEAYGAIRDKERDLLLSAEIGKSLLEQNIAIKSKYEDAQSKYEDARLQLQNLQRSRPKGIFSLQHTQHTQLPPPATSLETFMEERDEYDESDTESICGAGYSSSFEPISGDSAFKRKGHQNSNPGLSYKDLENLRELEVRNQDLQQKLEEVTKEHEDSEKTNRSKIRKLEIDLNYLQESSAMANQKIEELEKTNENLVQKQRAEFWNLKYNKKSNDYDDYIDALLHKAQELEDQNISIEKSKSEVERRLKRTADELIMLKGQYDDVMDRLENYEYLQHVNRDQEKLISELNENLEEHRAQLVSFRNRGVWSQKTSRTNSISEGNIMSQAIRRLSDPDGMRSMFGVPPKPQKTSLLSEFEAEMYRKFQEGDYDIPSFSPSSSVGDLHDYFLTGGARTDDDMEYLSDDDFSFLDEFEVDNEKANRLREWFWRRWIRAIYRFLRWIWRWCRFIVVLIAAVFMALYRGPDDVLA